MFLDYIKFLNAKNKTNMKTYSQCFSATCAKIDEAAKEIYLRISHANYKQNKSEQASNLNVILQFNEITAINMLLCQYNVKSKTDFDNMVTMLNHFATNNIASFIKIFKTLNKQQQSSATIQFLLSAFQAKRKNDTNELLLHQLQRYFSKNELDFESILTLIQMKKITISYDDYKHYCKLKDNKSGILDQLYKTKAAIDSLVSQCLGVSYDTKQFNWSIENINSYIDECGIREDRKSHLFYNDNIKPEVQKQQRDALIGFFKPIKNIIQACKHLKEANLPNKDLKRFFIDRFLRTYIHPAIANCDIPPRLQAGTFLQKSKRMLIIKENEVIKQCIDTSAFSLQNWALDDITDDHLTYAFYPAVRIMLEGPDSIIHFSQLDELINKSNAHTGPLIIKQTALADIISTAKKNTDINTLREIIKCFISDSNLSIAALSVRIQYTNILYGTSVFNDYYESVIQGNTQEITSNIKKWKIIAHHERFKPRPLDQVIKDYKSQKEIKYPLQDDELACIHAQYKTISYHSDKLQSIDPHSLLSSVKTRLAQYQPKPDCSFIDDIKEEDELYILAVLREFYKQTYGIFPYNLQMLNCLALLKRNKAVVQIKTGEGKSTIITLLAAYMALKGHKIDIITTSKDLAVRDAEKFEKFYKTLQLTCGHIEQKHVNTEHLKPNIVYGQITSFEFIHLFGLTKSPFNVDRIEDADRDYDVVLVDEADSMFLDTALSGARIASRAQQNSVEHFKWIWQYTKDRDRTTVDELKDYLYQHAPDNSGWSFTIKELNAWLSASENAKNMHLNIDYVIAPNDENIMEIVIVDKKHTGALLVGQTWSKGLTQIISAKHDIPIPNKTRTLASMSHVNFFRLYQNTIIGLTGTLGDNYIRNEFSEVYGLSTYDSPRYRESNKEMLPHELYDTEIMQYEGVLAVVRKMAQDNRPVLIISEHIQETLSLKAKLQKLSDELGCCLQLYNAVQEENVESILSFAGTIKTITIATNTAGRGADIVPSPAAEAAGGLHVILTFPTENKRVEEQAFGRTGRQGRKGTFQYILDYNRLEKSAQKVGCYDEEISIDQWLLQRELYCQQGSQNRIHSIGFKHQQYCAFEFIASLPSAVVYKALEHWENVYALINAAVNSANDPETLRSTIYMHVHNIWAKILKEENTDQIKDELISPLHYAVYTENKEAVQGILSLPFARQYFYLPQLTQQKLIRTITNITNQEIKNLLEQFISNQPKRAIKGIYEILDSIDISDLGGEHIRVKSKDLISSFETLTKDSFLSIFASLTKSLGELAVKVLLKQAILNPNLTVNNIISILQIAISLSRTSVYPRFLSSIEKESYKQITDQLPEWKAISHAERYPEKPITEVIESFHPQDKSVDIRFPIDKRLLQGKHLLCKRIIDKSQHLISMSDVDLNSYYETLKKHNRSTREESMNEGMLCDALAVIREIYKREFNIYPYNLQILNVLLMLDDQQYFAQIKTGEGKSTVIAILTSLLAFNGEKISIATSSGDLAIRDKNKFNDFFNRLGFTINDNCSYDTQTPEIYSADIVYGTITEFEFAYLYSTVGSQNFQYDKNLHKRSVIVDECDSMMLDKMKQGAIITGSCGRFTSSTYKALWDYFCNNIKNSNETEATILKEMDDFLKANNIATNMYDDQQLSRWLDALYQANQAQRDINYIVERNSKGEEDVIIIDLDTGQKEIGLRWMNGKHAFVEAKEDIKVQTESVVNASIQHCTFLNLYSRIYGLTGTLGNQTTRKALQSLYGLKSYDSPRYRLCISSLSHTGHIVCDDYKQKINAMINVVLKITQQQRPTLIICHSIKDVKTVRLELQSHVKEVNIYDGTQDGDTDHILALAGSPGVVTIATDTAGRGADIIPLPKSNDSGGLHVILFHAPRNERILWQAFGRTGRQGQPGSYHMIVTRDELISHFPSPITLSTPNRTIRITQEQLPTLEKKQILAIYGRHISGDNDSLREAQYLHHQQDTLHQALLIYANLPFKIKADTSEAWAQCYSALHRIPMRARDNESMQIYKNQLCKHLMAFWDKRILTTALPEDSPAATLYRGFTMEHAKHRLQSQLTDKSEGSVKPLSTPS